MPPRRPAPRPSFVGPFELENRDAPAVITVATAGLPNDAAVQALVDAFVTANTNADLDDTIVIQEAGRRFVFNKAFDPFDGGTALPVLEAKISIVQVNVPLFEADGKTPLLDPTTGKQATGPVDRPIPNSAKLTVQGNGAQFVRPAGAPSFRFLRAQGEPGEIPDPVTKLPVLALATLAVSDLTLDGGNVFVFGGGDYASVDRVTRTKISELKGGPSGPSSAKST